MGGGFQPSPKCLVSITYRSLQIEGLENGTANESVVSPCSLTFPRSPRILQPISEWRRFGQENLNRLVCRISTRSCDFGPRIDGRRPRTYMNRQSHCASEDRSCFRPSPISLSCQACRCAHWTRVLLSFGPSDLRSPNACCTNGCTRSSNLASVHR